MQWSQDPVIPPTRSGVTATIGQTQEGQGKGEVTFIVAPQKWNHVAYSNHLIQESHSYIPYQSHDNTWMQWAVII